MATGYEVKFYRDISMIADALDRIARALEGELDVAAHVSGEVTQ
jgi:hypothetical protein